VEAIEDADAVETEDRNDRARLRQAFNTSFFRSVCLFPGQGIDRDWSITVVIPSERSIAIGP
jgi:hypothetical protein